MRWPVFVQRRFRFCTEPQPSLEATCFSRVMFACSPILVFGSIIVICTLVLESMPWGVQQASAYISIAHGEEPSANSEPFVESKGMASALVIAVNCHPFAFNGSLIEFFVERAAGSIPTKVDESPL